MSNIPGNRKNKPYKSVTNRKFKIIMNKSEKTFRGGSYLTTGVAAEFWI